MTVTTGNAAAVVDASSFVRFHTGDEQATEWMRAALRAHTILLAPELVLAEVANALLAYQRRALLAQDDLLESLDDLSSTIELVPLSDLFPEAVGVAMTRGLTAYDACYVVLAEDVGVPLLTADRRLAAATDRGVLLA